MNKKRNFLGFSLIIIGSLLTFLFALAFSEKGLFEINSNNKEENPQFSISNSNSLLALSNPSNPGPKVIEKKKVIITAYSSTVGQTDDTPFITASGKRVKWGIVANNKYPFGTKIRIPELFGEEIFVVEDRMARKKWDYHIDIWFPSRQKAENFGSKKTYIEVLEG